MKIILKTLGVMVGAVLFFYLMFYIGWGQNYSSGERTGEFYKFSEKGLIYKSFEGAMYLGGVHSTDSGLQLDKFYFSIPKSEVEQKQELIDKINECARERLACTIKYKQWFKNPIYVESRYIVEDVIMPTK